MSSSSTGLATHHAPSSASQAEHDDTAFEMLESVLVLIAGAVVAAPVLPGFTLCVPVLSLVAVVVLAPLLAAAALVTLAGAILAIPFLLVRGIRSLRSHPAVRAPESVSALATDA